MYYLLGKKLIRFWSEDVGVYHMKPEAKIFDALIGNTYESATVYPNIPTEVGEDKVLIIDMPGTFMLIQASAIRGTSTDF
jgi:hypothetical protein